MKTRFFTRIWTVCICAVLLFSSITILPVSEIAAQSPTTASNGTSTSETLMNGSDARDPDKALLLSATQTVFPFAISTFLINGKGGNESLGYLLASYGLLVGPSTGYMYGRNSNQAFGGFMLRALGGIVVTAGGIVFNDNLFSSSRSKGLLGIGLMITGGGIITYSIIADIVRVKSAVMERNAFYATKNVITMVPIYAGSEDGYGFALRVRL